MKTGNNKKFSAGKEYRKSWDYIKESRNFIFSVILIFLFFSLIGFFIPAPEYIKEQVYNFLKEILEKTENLSAGEMITFIFFNNLQTSFFSFVFGVMFGILPLITAAVNGYVLGFVAFMSVEANGIFSLLRLFPHGIFELPAVFLSLGLGLKLGLWLIIEPVKFYWKKNKAISFLFVLFYLPTLIFALTGDYKFKIKMKANFLNFQKNFRNSLMVFFLIIFPLLIIAAIVEGILMFTK